MIISRTPLRISFIGGGTDFQRFYSQLYGRVISCAIDKYIYVIVKDRFDDLIVLNYSQKEIVTDVSDIKHGIIRECMKCCAIKGGIEITTLADIPSEGSGLGSSSAVTVGVLNALYAYIGQPQTADTLAEQACEIEIKNLRKPIGKQDQYIVAYGGIRDIFFHKDGQVNVADLTYGNLSIGNNLFLHYTDKTRKADDILKEQDNNTAQNTRALTSFMVMANIVEIAIKKGDYEEIGFTLKEAWKIKKTLASGISNPEIDEMIAYAEDNGAIGSKLCGAGGAGFILSYVDSYVHEKFKKSMSKYRELPIKIDQYGSRIIFNIR